MSCDCNCVVALPLSDVCCLQCVMVVFHDLTHFFRDNLARISEIKMLPPFENNLNDQYPFSICSMMLPSIITSFRIRNLADNTNSSFKQCTSM